jgi:hypothetical protein
MMHFAYNVTKGEELSGIDAKFRMKEQTLRNLNMIIADLKSRFSMPPSSSRMTSGGRRRGREDASLPLSFHAPGAGAEAAAPPSAVPALVTCPLCCWWCSSPKVAVGALDLRYPPQGLSSSSRWSSGVRPAAARSGKAAARLPRGVHPLAARPEKAE